MKQLAAVWKQEAKLQKALQKTRAALDAMAPRPEPYLGGGSWCGTAAVNSRSYPRK